jgi:hypothetical protein
MPSGFTLGKEPVAIISIVVAVLQVVQSVAISGISAGVHGVIAVVLVVLGGVLARGLVTPVPKAIAPAA